MSLWIIHEATDSKGNVHQGKRRVKCPYMIVRYHPYLPKTTFSSAVPAGFAVSLSENFELAYKSAVHASKRFGQDCEILKTTIINQ